MTRAVLLAAAILGLALGEAPGLGLAETADARYAALLSQAQAGAAGVDWTALRLAYADRPGFGVPGSGDEAVHLQAMRNAFREGDYTVAITEAKRVVDVDFVNPEAHLIASQSYLKKSNAGLAAREREIALGLLKSIQTGDGHSTASPYTVISVDEEYVLIAAIGRRVTRQSLLREGGHSYDVLETVDRAGAAATYYFLIDKLLAAEAHVLQLPAAK